MKRVAVVIPIHPPHYEYIYNLLTKTRKHGLHMDIFLVFSSKEHYELFTMKDDIKPIIAEDVNPRAVTTYKKFYALQRLADSAYDYFIVCDAEIDIVPENLEERNILEKIEAIFANKVLYGGDVQGNAVAEKIMESCRSAFLEYESILMRYKAGNLYTWWSDLPVYKREHLGHFFSRIPPLELLTWENFDHLLYQYYLLVHHDFHVANITPATGVRWSLEHLMGGNPAVLTNLEKMGFGFGWITKKNFRTAPEYFVKQGAFLIYHMDHF